MEGQAPPVTTQPPLAGVICSPQRHWVAFESFSGVGSVPRFTAKDREGNSACTTRGAYWVGARCRPSGYRYWSALRHSA